MNRTNVGPLKNKNNILKYEYDEMAEILNDQYSSICTTPRVMINDEFIKNLIDTEIESKLCDIHFDKDSIKEAINKLTCKSI